MPPPGAGMPPGGMPAGGMPFGAQAGAQPGFGGQPGQAQPANLNPTGYKFGVMNKDFKTNVKIPTHKLKFDEFKFLKLLAGSISLTRDEKKKIIESVPKLKQTQIDELIRILEEEKTKFVELSDKHAAQLEKLEKQHLEDWKDLEVSTKQDSKKGEDEAEADEIRKNLGL